MTDEERDPETDGPEGAADETEPRTTTDDAEDTAEARRRRGAMTTSRGGRRGR